MFGDLDTQWRTGMNGREGLIYSEAFTLMSEKGIRKKKKRLDIFQSLRVMENAALEIFRKRHGR